jgi:hypothetical protein
MGSRGDAIASIMPNDISSNFWKRNIPFQRGTTRYIYPEGAKPSKLRGILEHFGVGLLITGL